MQKTIIDARTNKPVTRETIETGLDPRLTHWLATTGGAWGKGPTKKIAIEKMEEAYGMKPKTYHLWRCTPKTYVNGEGGITRPTGDPAAERVDG